MFFKIAQKIDKHLDNLFKTFCQQEVSKIAQSGHTAIYVQRENTCLNNEVSKMSFLNLFFKKRVFQQQFSIFFIGIL